MTNQASGWRRVSTIAVIFSVIVLNVWPGSMTGGGGV